MKRLIRLMGVVFACGALGTTAFAGTETYSGKEMRLRDSVRLDDQSFQNTRTFLIADEFRAFTGRFTGETFGHIVRAGLNYKF